MKVIDFEGNTVLSKLNPLLGYGNKIRGEGESYKALAGKLDAIKLDYDRILNSCNKFLLDQLFVRLDHLERILLNEHGPS